MNDFDSASEVLQVALDNIDEVYRLLLKVDSADGKCARIELGEAVGLIVIVQKKLVKLAEDEGQAGFKC